tara:strand:+ start:137 stop:574 length:438 start_codon:yes stop_codon:yes gene_type:complete
MEEIYSQLDKLYMQTQVNDYIKYNKKPEYPTQKYNIPPQLPTSNLLIYNQNNSDNDILYDIYDMNKILNKINILQKEIKEFNEIENLQNELNNDYNCPICLEILNDNSYIVTKCKHKTCLKCYIHCLNQNKEYSNKCSICRTNII